MSIPLLTVAIPFRGNRSYLREAVQSVISQDCPKWRLVVCEDASGEKGIASMLATFRDTRISHVCDATSLGIAGVFNRCIELSTTDLVTLLHHDDRLRRNYVGNMLAAAQRHPEAVAFFCRAKLIDVNGRHCLRPRDMVKGLLSPSFPVGERILRGPDAAAALLRANFIVGPSMCFRRSRLADRRFDPRWKQVLDFALNMRLLVEGEMLVGLAEPAYAYRRHIQQTTSKNLKRLTFFTEQSQLFDELAQQAQRLGWPKVVETARAKRIIKFDLGCQAVSDVVQMKWLAAAAKFELLIKITRERIAIDTD